MDDLIPRAFGLLRSIWAHRRLGVLVAWVVGILAAGIVIRIPDKYEASARIFVDTQSILKPLMTGLAVQPNYDQQIMMLSRTLITRPNIEEIIRMADLDLGSKSQEAHDELVDQLLKRLEIRSTTRDNNIYTLSYRDVRQDHAKKVVQAAVSIFIGSSLGDKRIDARSAIKFIEDQIKIYEKKLEEAETRLKEFKIRHVEVQQWDSKGGGDRLPDVLNQLNTAKLALREAEHSRDVLKQQLAGMVGAPGPKVAEGAVAIPEIDGRLDAMKRNLDAMLQRYTDEHPDVIGARRVIRELEEQRNKELAARKAAAVNAPAAAKAANPVQERLSISLAESEANIASLRARVAEYDSRVIRIKEMMKTLPQVEAEFSQLNRDYEIQKKNYELLVSRRESASLSGDLGTAGGGAEFRQIDPPRVNPQPVAPNRLLLLPGALAFSILAGFGAAYLVSQLRPAYFDAESLRHVTGLPLLGTVSLTPNETMKKAERRSVRHVLLATGGLIILYGAGIAVLALRSAA